MPVVETLLVGVQYQVDQGSLSTVTSQFGKAAGFLSGAATAAIGLGSALAVSSISLANSQDATAKLAATLTTTTEELTSLQFAADRSGVSGTQLITTLERLNRSATDAAQDGTSEAARAFRDLGISARDANGELKSPAELLPEIAGGLEGVTDSGRRSEIMIELLGRSALRMGGLLGLGAEGIKDLTDRAVDLGIALDSGAAARSELLVDAITDLKGVTGAFAREIGDTVIPHLTDAANATTEWLVASDGLARVGLDRTIAGLTFVLDGLETPLGKSVAGATALAAVLGSGGPLLRAIPLLGPAITGLGASIGLAALPATALATAIAFSVLAIDDLIVTAEGGQSVTRRLADSLGVGDEAVRILAASATIASDAIAIGFLVADDTIRTTIDSLAAGVEWMADLADQAAEAFPPLQGIADVIGDIADGIGGLAKLGIGNLAGLLEGVAGVTGRARTGELTEEETGALGSDFFGARVAVALESGALRAETGEGLGIAAGKKRRREIEDLGLVSRQERNIAPGLGQLSALRRSEDPLNLRPLAGTGASAASLTVDTALTLALTLGASIEDIADQIAEAARAQAVTQLSTVEGLQ